MRKKCIIILLGILVSCLAAQTDTKTKPSGTASRKGPIKGTYKGYVPDFVNLIARQSRYGGRIQGYAVGKDVMRLSTEPSFYTLCRINESDRANALVEAGIKKEEQGQFREALDVYQKVIDNYPGALYRVSKYGVFVPISLYCQLRIIGFPKADLEFYRNKHDARAKEAFEQATQKHSLEGLAEIRDKALATSYGSQALRVLGNAALDKGHYLEALEYFETIRTYFIDSYPKKKNLDLCIGLCRKMLGMSADLPADTGNDSLAIAMKKILESARPKTEDFFSQKASAPYLGSDDYTLFPPTTDPMGLKYPIWKTTLPASRNEVVIYTHPVVTDRSVIYRHKNIVYCRSILNGELQWMNDTGGRVTWQNRHERQFPHERILVQDGLVFTPMYKVGPSLVALDEVTGQLKWAYGPLVASTKEEAQMRFEAAPAGGPRTVYAGYILDNIEGETHIDSEYGVMAFDSITGRMTWRSKLCQLQPGKFSAGFAVSRRNRIRSFMSPPLYHQGTVYYCTNAGTIAALDALSGQVKWLMRYPYYPVVHDATRQFGKLPAWSGTVFTQGMHEPSFWYGQRPWVVSGKLYMLPVDSAMMHCLDRKTGRVNWSRAKGGGNYTYMMGPTREGHLVLTHSGRGGVIHLIDQKNGKTVWTSPDPILPETHPVMTYSHDPYGSAVPGGFNGRGFFLVARPFLTSDDRIFASYYIDCGFNLSPWCANLAEISLKERKIINRRRYYVQAYLAFIGNCINIAKGRLKQLKELPHKDAKTKDMIKKIEDISKDTVPENTHGPFLPFSRVTFKRFGGLFELRLTSRTLSMMYDQKAVEKVVAGRKDADGLFARAELALSKARQKEASILMKQCLNMISSEDLDFRARVNQQLHQVHKRLAQKSVRSRQKELELANCLGMSRTVTRLSEEMEAIMALSEAHERQGNYKTAAKLAQNIVSAYGHYEYPIPSLFSGNTQLLIDASGKVLDRTATLMKKSVYGKEIGRPTALAKRMMELYFSALSPLEKDLTVRAGDLAVSKLIRLQNSNSEFRKNFREEGKAQISGKLSVEEQFHSLRKYPATPAGQSVLNSLFDKTTADLSKKDTAFSEKAELRKQLWKLADTARVAGLKIPERYRSRVLAPSAIKAPSPLTSPLQDNKIDLSDKRGPAWMVLDRRDDLSVKPDFLFVGARVKKKFDNKFLLRCISLKNSKTVWNATEKRGKQWFDEIRLKGKGTEPGFTEVFVHKNLVVVHGMYDVLAFSLTDGKIKWRYRVPFDFDIFHVSMSGDILVLSGPTESIALYVPAANPTGEVAWQEKEEGNIYTAPYFMEDRLVEVRKMPFNVTVRYRTTGKLIGRLILPDLMLYDGHPLLATAPRALPAAHDGKLLVVTDGWYYVMVDVDRMKVIWKRLIDANDMTRLPPIRFALNGDYLAVVKQDYDVKTIYMLSSRTGKVLWHTDPKVPSSPQPIHSMHIRDSRLYGIGLHQGQGFFFTGIDCRTGKHIFRANEQKGYEGKPKAVLRLRIHGKTLVAMVKDRQDFELKAFSIKSGKLLHTIMVKSTGDFGEHGRTSATVQNGSMVLLGKDELKTAVKK